uniref:Uncharacterized protein n=2 Tax=Anguilla anguilla TaxID=7936 RepID=A0A0E9QUJ0_ANGAN
MMRKSQRYMTGPTPSGDWTGEARRWSLFPGFVVSSESLPAVIPPRTKEAHRGTPSARQASLILVARAEFSCRMAL